MPLEILEEQKGDAKASTVSSTSTSTKPTPAGSPASAIEIGDKEETDKEKVNFNLIT